MYYVDRDMEVLVSVHYVGIDMEALDSVLHTHGGFRQCFMWVKTLRC